MRYGDMAQPASNNPRWRLFEARAAIRLGANPIPRTLTSATMAAVEHLDVPAANLGYYRVVILSSAYGNVWGYEFEQTAAVFADMTSAARLARRLRSSLGRRHSAAIAADIE